VKNPSTLFHRHKKTGATLIELIVVIFVVAALASLIIPAFRRAQQSAQAGVCISNLKNIGSAFRLYASENDNLFPAARFANRGETNLYRQNPSGKNWQTEIHPYLRDVKSYGEARGNADIYVFCPTYVNEYRKDPDAKKLQASGYGMNNSLATGSWDYRFNSVLIKSTARAILVGDSDDYFLKVTKNLEPNKGDRYSGYSDRCGDPVRHLGKANYVFVDGHVSTLDQEEAATFFDDYGKL